MATTTVTHLAINPIRRGRFEIGTATANPDGLHGACEQRFAKEVTVDMTGGAGTVTCTGVIPDGALDVYVVGRVTTVITGATVASFTIGDTDADRFGAGIALAAGTTFDSTGYTAAPTSYGAATDLVFTANAGTFSAGVVRLVIFYTLAIAPTS